SHSFPCRFYFFFNAASPTEIYTLSLHDALPILNIARNVAIPNAYMIFRIGLKFINLIPLPKIHFSIFLAPSLYILVKNNKMNDKEAHLGTISPVMIDNRCAN